MTWIADLANLSLGSLLMLSLVVFLAGLVRGFSGFALSAVIMAIAAAFIPPIQLLPILWFLEMAASLVMLRGGIREADHKTVGLLVIGSWIGWPIGLYLITTLPTTSSKAVALTLIIVLALLQLTRVRLPGLTTPWGTFLTGVAAGIVSGLAHLGGMVVALFVLAQGTAARSMRGTLVMYLFIGSLGSLFFQLGFGVMDTSGALRGLILTPPTLLGVLMGTLFFNPRWEPYYKPFCLTLLVLLAASGLVRLMLT